MAKPQGYTRLQIGLHWLIAILIGLDFAITDGMETAWRIVRNGGEANLWQPHTVIGAAVIALAVLRIAIKLFRGSPALPEDEPRWQQISAHAAHGVLYLLMFLMPLTGFAAWYAGKGIWADLHDFSTSLLILAFLLHAAGALYHHYILKSDVMERMLKPKKG